jgi:hypothetical protein
MKIKLLFERKKHYNYFLKNKKIIKSNQIPFICNKITAIEEKVIFLIGG